ncbi:unnamed protein product [Paramecium pentaurelia]|uniref:Uncharacterized protein n=1 Tax=Paramecium pentaurelia TaxID=43138 RepID=A0A8S1Y481_9CILI|nr:unnamed protein product [Paramecium pentaurelia]
MQFKEEKNAKMQCMKIWRDQPKNQNINFIHTIQLIMDPAHPYYIPAQRQDYKQRLTVDTHNMLIDGVKRDVNKQKQVDKAIKNLDRPYMKGKSGVTKNITGGLRDYFLIEIPYAQTGNLENERIGI